MPIESYEMERAMGEFIWTPEARDLRERVQFSIAKVVAGTTRDRRNGFSLVSATHQTLFRTELLDTPQGPMRLTLAGGRVTDTYYQLIDEFIQLVINGYRWRGPAMSRGDTQRGVVVWSDPSVQFVRFYSPEKTVVSIENPLRCSSPFDRKW